jgi:hypothetical protein
VAAPFGAGKTVLLTSHRITRRFQIFELHPVFPSFTATGIDYTSACIVRTDNGDIKVYISLFTCAASRAIHLEVLTDLSAKEFTFVWWLLAADGGPRQVQLEKNAWLVKTNV